MRQIGALIEKGPVDWQIIQQADGKADIFLEGSWMEMEGLENPTVFARVVREDSSAAVHGWMPAKMHGKKWSAVLEGIPAGGLYRLETCIGQEPFPTIDFVVRGDMVHHLGVGDLYVIAGQSNSAGYGKEPVYDAPEMGVHLLKNSGRWDLATHPMNDTTDTIHEANYELHNSGASPYLSFAKYLKRELNYPIGLLQTSVGSSPLSLWEPYEEASLYHNMMDVIRSQGGRVKGILWYQGCADALGCLSEDYLERFQRMVLSVRRELNYDVPYLTAQLNRLVATFPPLDLALSIQNREWGRIREAQRQAARRLADVFVIPTTDCSLSDEIHNSAVSNILLGERFAVSALRHIYGKTTGYDAPDLEKVIQTGKKSLRLEFSHVADKLFTFSLPAEELAISVFDGSGALMKLADYSLDGSNINITLEQEVTEGCFVCGASDKNPSQGIPMDRAAHIPMLSFYGAGITQS